MATSTPSNLGDDPTTSGGTSSPTPDEGEKALRAKPKVVSEPDKPSLLNKVSESVKAGVRNVTDSIGKHGATEFKKQTARINGGIKALKGYIAGNSAGTTVEQHTFLEEKGFDLAERNSIIEAINNLATHERNKVETQQRIIERQKAVASERALNKALHIEQKNVETARKETGKPPFKPEKLILATTLAAHAGTSIIGSIAGGAWAVTKGAGRIVREEVIGIANSTLDLGKQAGKTIVYPFGRIGYGAKNRASRALDWAINLPNPPGGKKKNSEEPVHKDEPKEASPAATSSGKKNILSRGLSGAWNLTKRAWYRTQQGVLITVATPLALVAGAVEGATLAIPHDIIGVHWKGEASVRETGAVARKTTDKGFHVDGGAAGIVLSVGKMLKDIAWDAPIRAFEEQLTTIKETPIVAEVPVAESSTSSGGGSAPTAPVAESKPAEEHAGEHKKSTIAPVNTNGKNKNGIISGIKSLKNVWKEDEMSTAQAEDAVDALDSAFGKEGSLIGSMAKGAINILKSADKDAVNYDEIGKQILKLRVADRVPFFKGLNMVEFRKRFRILLDTSGIRFTDALKTPEGIAKAKKEIATLFDIHEPIDNTEVGALIDALYAKLGIVVPNPPAISGTTAGKPTDLRLELENVRKLLTADPTRLRQLHHGEVRPLEINYKTFGKQVLKLNTGDIRMRDAFIDAFDEADFREEFWPILDSGRLAKAIKEDNADSANKKEAMAKIASLLNITGAVTKTDVSNIIGEMEDKLGISGMVPLTPKQVGINAFLNQLLGALNDDNLAKIYGEEAKDVNIEYEKFGAQVLKLKAADLDKFKSAFNAWEFADRFAIITNKDTLAKEMPKSIDEVKARLAELTGFKGAINSESELAGLVKQLTDKLGVTGATTGRDGDLRKAIEKVIGVIDDATLNKLYPAPKDEIDIKYETFGDQLLSLKDEDMDKFVKAFNSRKFKSTFSPLQTAGAFKSAMEQPENVKNLLANVLGYKGAIGDIDELTELIDDINKKLDTSTLSTKEDIKKLLNGTGSAITLYRASFTNETAFQVLFPAHKETPTAIHYDKFGQQAKGLRMDKDRNKFLEAFDMNTFDENFNCIISNAGLNLIEKTPAVKARMQEQIEQLLGRKPLVVDEFIQLINSLSSSINLTDPSKMTATASTNHGRLKEKLAAIASRFGNADEGKGNFEKVLKTNPELKKVTVQYDMFGVSFPDQKNDIINFLHSLKMREIYTRYGLFTSPEKVKALIGKIPFGSLTKDETEDANIVSAFVGIKVNNLTLPTLQLSVDSMLRKLDNDKLGLDTDSEEYERLEELKAFISKAKLDS